MRYLAGFQSRDYGWCLVVPGVAGWMGVRLGSDRAGIGRMGTDGGNAQIYVVQPGLLKAGLDGRFGGLVAHRPRRDLGREEDHRARDSRGAHRVGAWLFVAVRAGGVDVPVACLEGMKHDRLTVRCGPKAVRSGSGLYSELGGSWLTFGRPATPSEVCERKSMPPTRLLSSRLIGVHHGCTTRLGLLHTPKPKAGISKPDGMRYLVLIVSCSIAEDPEVYDLDDLI